MKVWGIYPETQISELNVELTVLKIVTRFSPSWSHFSSLPFWRLLRRLPFYLLYGSCGPQGDNNLGKNSEKTIQNQY